MTSLLCSRKEERLAKSLLLCLLSARRSAQKGKTGNMKDQTADSVKVYSLSLLFQRDISLRLVTAQLLLRVHLAKFK